MSFRDNNKTNDNNINPHDEDEYYYGITASTSGSGISEIEEEEENHVESARNGDVSREIKELLEVKRFSPMPSIKEEHDKGSVLSGAEDHNSTVYVAVGKSPSSLDALDWTLKNAVNAPSMIVYLIHIYRETKQIPTPLGKLPLSQVSREQVETFMAQERGKRRELLEKFLYRCSAANVNVETILIESDVLPKAILDLIGILNIRKLVVGTTKSSLRKLRSRRGTGTADQILKNAPETCEVKIICEGTEVIIDQAVESPSPRGNVDSFNESDNSKTMQQEQREEEEDHDKRNEAISCMCFKSKFGTRLQ